MSAPESARRPSGAAQAERIEAEPWDYDGESAYRLYLREVGQIRLLTPQEEIALAKRVRKGDKQARDEMIKANLRLVVKIAHDYEGCGLPLLDLINEGNIGLIKGVERFDPSKGAKLSTYAAWWIKQAMKRALANQSKTIRLPVHVVDKLAHIRRAEVKLHDLLAREPTDDEVAAELGIEPKRLRHYRTMAARPASLDAPLQADDSTRMADVIQDESAATPYQKLEASNDATLVRDIMAGLDPREQAVLRYRFGLDGSERMTLEEIGERFGVTRERIRQIQEEALDKLRRKMKKLDAIELAA